MEPVFMMTSHSAGVAAAFAIDDQVPVQQVRYPKLAAQLIADGQILSWGGAQSIGTNGIIQTVTDSSGVTATGAWTAGANSGGWPLPNGTYWHDGNAGKGTKSVRFSQTVSTNGYYDVYIWWVYADNRATNTPVDIVSATATNRVFLNQQINCTNWVKIATSNYFNAGTGGSVTISNANTTGYVIANAVRWMPLGNIAPPGSNTPVVEVVASDANTSEFGTNSARFTIVCPNGPNSTPLTVNYSVGGTATPGVDYATLPGTMTLAAGATATNILVIPLGDNLSANKVSVTLNLIPSAGYLLATLTNATVNILDRPLNNWLRSNFTATELANSLISGDAADPDQDRIPNLIEYALGLSPKIQNPNPFTPSFSNGVFGIAYTLSDTAIDVSLTPAWSTNLLNWFSGTNYFQIITLSDNGSSRSVFCHPVQSMPAAAFRFSATRN
jgi:hypothetical protein